MRAVLLPLRVCIGDVNTADRPHPSPVHVVLWRVMRTDKEVWWCTTTGPGAACVKVLNVLQMQRGHAGDRVLSNFVCDD